MKKVSDIDVMSRMATENLDIKVSSHVVSARTNKKGGVVEMGVDTTTAQTIINSVLGETTHYTLLFIMDCNQFKQLEEKMQQEMEQSDASQDVEAIHSWFGLSYASYLVLPRSVLQSMPDAWQAKFVELLNDIPKSLHVDDLPNYQVNAVDANGRFIKDQFKDYQRGRRRIPKRLGWLHR